MGHTPTATFPYSWAGEALVRARFLPFLSLLPKMPLGTTCCTIALILPDQPFTSLPRCIRFTTFLFTPAPASQPKTTPCDQIVALTPCSTMPYNAAVAATRFGTRRFLFDEPRGRSLTTIPAHYLDTSYDMRLRYCSAHIIIIMSSTCVFAKKPLPYGPKLLEHRSLVLAFRRTFLMCRLV